MDVNKILSLGWITAALFVAGSLVLGSFLADYSSLSQTVTIQSACGTIANPVFPGYRLFCQAK